MRAACSLKQFIRPGCSQMRSLSALTSSKLRMSTTISPKKRWRCDSPTPDTQRSPSYCAQEALCSTRRDPDPKWKVHGALLKYADPASIDFKAIAETYGITTRAVSTDEGLQRLGIVKGGDGKYYKASDGPGGSIVLRPVDLCVLVRFQLRARFSFL